GLTSVDAMLPKRKKGKAEAALIALDPRTGEILSFVGGRSYNQSQYDRAILSRRQPGSVFKPFVYLAAFEQAAAEGRTDITPATITRDEQETFEFDEQVWTPENYEKEYNGPVTYRFALAHSLNLATIHVAQAAGYDRVAALWKKLGVGNTPKAYPSIALSVLDEGTAAAARGMGFTLEASGKTGTTNDKRDAWFVGFTPELLTVVWVGLDDNQPVGLTGAQAALPIWVDYMTRALAGRESV